jgi:hypothetical protein
VRPVKTVTADYKTMRKAARLPERTVPTCFRGDLVAEFESLERELDEARKANADSLDSGTGALLERMDAVQAEMRENTYLVRLRGMGFPAWNAFTARHAARRDDDGKVLESDAGLGVNVETFWPALIRASIVDPELATDADWEEFVEGITDYQYGELGNAAFNLNRSGVDIPFSLAASTMKRPSADA